MPKPCTLLLKTARQRQHLPLRLRLYNRAPCLVRTAIWLNCASNHEALNHEGNLTDGPTTTVSCCFGNQRRKLRVHRGAVDRCTLLLPLTTHSTVAPRGNHCSIRQLLSYHTFANGMFRPFPRWAATVKPCWGHHGVTR